MVFTAIIAFWDFSTKSYALGVLMFICFVIQAILFSKS